MFHKIQYYSTCKEISRSNISLTPSSEIINCNLISSISTLRNLPASKEIQGSFIIMNNQDVFWISKESYISLTEKIGSFEDSKAKQKEFVELPLNKDGEIELFVKNAKEFTERVRRMVGGMVSEDYLCGYEEGIYHYLTAQYKKEIEK